MDKTDNKNEANTIIDHQKAIDTAINERIKEEQGDEKGNSIDPSDANNPARRERVSGSGQKKTGGGKQSNPGM